MNVEMDVKLLAYTQLSEEFRSTINQFVEEIINGKAIALSAIRTCYSPNTPSSIIPNESRKYFKEKATDNEEGTEADRLIRMIVRSKHVSTLEHTCYTFAIEGVSRALMSQITRSRHFSFSIQSQRYVSFESESKSKGFDFVIPKTIKENPFALATFLQQMQKIQEAYDLLREFKIPSEDCRSLLPNAAATNIVMTANLRSLLEFYSKRKKGNGAQHEITVLAEQLKECVIGVENWTAPFFE
jgi:thymidylate synthase (FAD)